MTPQQWAFVIYAIGAVVNGLWFLWRLKTDDATFRRFERDVYGLPGKKLQALMAALIVGAMMLCWPVAAITWSIVRKRK